MKIPEGLNSLVYYTQPLKESNIGSSLVNDDLKREKLFASQALESVLDAKYKIQTLGQKFLRDSSDRINEKSLFRSIESLEKVKKNHLELEENNKRLEVIKKKQTLKKLFKTKN